MSEDSCPRVEYCRPKYHITTWNSNSNSKRGASRGPRKRATISSVLLYQTQKRAGFESKSPTNDHVGHVSVHLVERREEHRDRARVAGRHPQAQAAPRLVYSRGPRRHAHLAPWTANSALLSARQLPLSKSWRMLSAKAARVRILSKGAMTASYAWLARVLCMIPRLPGYARRLSLPPSFLVVVHPH